MKPFLRMLESAEKCDELLSCIFGLNALERQLYLALVNEELNIKKVSLRVGKERSVVYRALQKLIDHGLCRKEKKLLAKGGYFFVYSAREPAQVKADILGRMAAMEEHLRLVLDDFGRKVEEEKKEYRKRRENPPHEPKNRG